MPLVCCFYISGFNICKDDIRDFAKIRRLFWDWDRYEHKEKKNNVK